MTMWIEQLRAGDPNRRQEAAIDISTTDPERCLNQSAVEKAVPELEKMLQSDTKRNRGTAANALARIAVDYSDLVEGFDEQVVDLLDDDTWHQNKHYNRLAGIEALTMFGGETYVNELKRVRDEFRGESQQVYSACKLALFSFSSTEPDIVQYRHIDLVIAHGVHILANHIDGFDASSSPDDYTILAHLLDSELKNKTRKRITDVLRDVATKKDFTDVVPYLAKPISDRQDSVSESAINILGETAGERPEEVTYLIDDVSAYLSPPQGIASPKYAVKFLAEVVATAPSQVGKHREAIEELQDHDDGEIRQYCDLILSQLDQEDTQVVRDTSSLDSTPSLSTDTDNSEAVIEDTSITEPETESEENLEELYIRAKENARETVTGQSSTAYTTEEYNRSNAVKRYVKARADGQCEGCGEPAPFTSKTDEPYLHAHHLFELSDGGPDTPDNMVALCPNCHYRVHHGKDGEAYNERLIRRSEETE